MKKAKGVSAATWFYGPQGFGSTRGSFPVTETEKARLDRIVANLCVVNGVHTGICETCSAARDVK